MNVLVYIYRKSKPLNLIYLILDLLIAIILVFATILRNMHSVIKYLKKIVFTILGMIRY